MSKLALFFSIAFLPARGGEMQCPETIAVEQQLKKPVEGWTASLDSTPLRLAAITVFDGKPEGRASLVNDGKRMGAKEWTATWRLTPGREYWISCSYSGSSVQLSRRVPAKATSCTVIYERYVTIAGSPAIKTIDCR